MIDMVEHRYSTGCACAVPVAPTPRVRATAAGPARRRIHVLVMAARFPLRVVTTNPRTSISAPKGDPLSGHHLAGGGNVDVAQGAPGGQGEGGDAGGAEP